MHVLQNVFAIECVLLLPVVFSYYMLCSLIICCVLVLYVVFSYYMLCALLLYALLLVALAGSKGSPGVPPIAEVIDGMPEVVTIDT